MERKYYIDNLRWLWIAILIPFHACMAYSNWEGNYVWIQENNYLSSFVIFVSPWFMPMLFVLAGMSAKYALTKRTYKQFLIERVKKLFIPLLVGLPTVAAYIAFIADKYHTGYSGNFFEHYKVFFSKITDFTGYDGFFTTGHLWFLLFLFIISIVALGIIALQRKIAPKLSFSKIPMLIVAVLIILPTVMQPILDFGGKSVGQFLGFFILGYYVLSEENVLEKLAKYKFISLAIMLICDIPMTIIFVWKIPFSDVILSIMQILASWFGILGFIGLAKCVFNQNNAFTKFMTSNSFLFYIFHFGWLVTVQYLFSKTELNTYISFALSIVISYVLTILTCEVIKRIPFVRTLFGIYKKKVTIVNKDEETKTTVKV